MDIKPTLGIQYNLLHEIEILPYKGHVKHSTTAQNLTNEKNTTYNIYIYYTNLECRLNKLKDHKKAQWIFQNILTSSSFFVNDTVCKRANNATGIKITEKFVVKENDKHNAQGLHYF